MRWKERMRGSRLNVMMVGVDIDVLKVQLVHSADLLLNGIQLSVQGSIDGASSGLWGGLGGGVCKVEQARPRHQSVPIGCALVPAPAGTCQNLEAVRSRHTMELRWLFLVCPAAQLAHKGS